MEKHKETKNNLAGSLLPIVIIVIAVLLTAGLYFYFTQGKNNPFVKKPAFNPCANEVINKTALINITSGSMTPSSVMICPGQEVKWVNNDTVAHKFTVTSKGVDSARLSATDPINPNESVSMTFDASETVKYSLSPAKPEFKGEIIVK